MTASSSQLVKLQRNNEAQGFATSIATNSGAHWARGYGLARALTLAVEDRARAHGFAVLGLDGSAYQAAAIPLYELLGCVCWGTNPAYAIANGRAVAGHYHSTQLGPLPVRPDGAKWLGTP